MTNWHREDCGNCRGYGVVSDYWGGDFNGAMECSECNGGGYVWISPKGRIAAYPGGPFKGRLTDTEIANMKDASPPEDSQ